MQRAALELLPADQLLDHKVRRRRVDGESRGRVARRRPCLEIDAQPTLDGSFQRACFDGDRRVVGDRRQRKQVGDGLDVAAHSDLDHRGRRAQRAVGDEEAAGRECEASTRPGLHGA